MKSDRQPQRSMVDIPLALNDPKSGEEKAQCCVIACLKHLGVGA